jgi:hypothetical protein
MTQIDLPFSREMAIAAIDGHKIATTRSEQKGHRGDVFVIPGVDLGECEAYTFRLIEIIGIDLDSVKNIYFRLEGFDSPEEFEKTWRALHRGHFTTGKMYYIHFFARVV